MKTLKTHRVVILFKSQHIYGREIIDGISDYMTSTRAAWDLFVENDVHASLSTIDAWQGDGIIADFNDELIRSALQHRNIPMVAVGSSFNDSSRYPARIPYVAFDNFKLIEAAYKHLVETGLTKFALFSEPPNTHNCWAAERETAFSQIARRDGFEANIFRGLSGNAPTWSDAGLAVVEWLRSLPKPVGVVAVSDERARQLLQACLIADIAVPSQVALIGIDNDLLARKLTRVPLSSVVPGTHEMGRSAARLLHELLGGMRHEKPPLVMVDPPGLNVLESSRHEGTLHPYVMRALYFIRQYACQNVRTEQVASYVGISRSSLESHFRQAMGRTVHAEVLHFKLAAATNMLTTTKTSVVEVAARCGFTSPQYMHTVFKRELGCTPKQYRDKFAA